jgi:hypothetical protein
VKFIWRWALISSVPLILTGPVPAADLHQQDRSGVAQDESLKGIDFDLPTAKVDGRPMGGSLTASALAVSAEAESYARISIYFQSRELEGPARAMKDRLVRAGYRVTTNLDPMHQIQRWANRVRFFHPDDAGLAERVREQLRAAVPDSGDWAALDLTEEFRSAKVRHGAIEVWFCDLEKNKALKPAAYEKKFEFSEAARLDLPAPAPTATVETEPVDPNDPYCFGWDPKDRKAFLDRQKGESHRDESDGPAPVDFVFYYSGAPHDHGAPAGSCGVRIEAYQEDGKGKRSLAGKWEDLRFGSLFEIVPGKQHCLFGASGDTADDKWVEDSFIIDAQGRPLWQMEHFSFLEAAWVQREGEEQLWVMDFGSIRMMRVDGTEVWQSGEAGTYYGDFFSDDRRYAFRLGKEALPFGTIYAQDGKDKWSFAIPYGAEKGQKTLLGLNKDGELAIRVNRRLYSVSRAGVPQLRAILPLYKGRHPAVDMTKAHTNFDGYFRYGRDHQFDYGTNVPRSYDHPRPVLRFNIDDFKAEESLDEGKHWHPRDIGATDKDESARTLPAGSGATVTLP